MVRATTTEPVATDVKAGGAAAPAPAKRAAKAARPAGAAKATTAKATTARATTARATTARAKATVAKAKGTTARAKTAPTKAKVGTAATAAKAASATTAAKAATTTTAAKAAKVEKVSTPAEAAAPAAAFVAPSFGRSDAWWPPVESPAESPVDGAAPGPYHEVVPAVPASPPPGPDTAAPGSPTKRGLPAPALVAIVLGSLALIGLVAALLTIALLGTDDESVTTAPAQSTAPAPPPEADAGAVAEEDASASALGPDAGQAPSTGPASAAFTTVPGFTFVELPPALLSEVQSQFEAGIEQGLAGDPALAGVAEELVAGIEGRMVVQYGEVVAVAVAISVDERWADLPGLTRAGVGGVGETLPPSAEQLTIAGQDAVFAETAGQSVVVSSRNGTMLLVSGISADRATLEQIMAGLLANL